MVKKQQRICINCKSSFEATGYAWNKVYCSTKCYDEYCGYHGAYGKMATSTVGAIAELLVSIDLFKKGFAVFRALSAACSCDLIAMKNNKILKIEVKSGYRNQKGIIAYPHHKKDNNNYDVLAIVVHRADCEINYIGKL